MMTKQNSAEERPPESGVSSLHASKERSVRWAYIWLLCSSLITVPWMFRSISRLDARLRQATRPWTGSEPAWSPDGQSIAFVSSRPGWETIYIMDADGTDPRQLLPEPEGFAVDYDPDWSPDGRRIAYSSDRTGNFEIYVADLEAGQAYRLTDNEAHDENPSWSPDGRQIAFWSDRAGQTDIYVMNADGSDVRRLTSDRAEDMWPDWSPDGQRLAFNSNRSKNHQIYVMDTDGGNVRRVGHTEDNQGWPRWSPDGTALVFEAEMEEGWEIEILYLAEGGSTRIESTTVSGTSPAWSPDGNRIVFTCFNQYRPEAVCVMAPDGSGLVDLTARLTAEALAASPVPTSSYVGAVTLPALLLLVLLVPLGSRLLYVRRHTQQAVALAAARVCSTVLIMGLSRGELIGLWVVINGGLWLFGTVWGLRQIRRGECWLMRRRGEAAGLPRTWAAKPTLAPTATGEGSVAQAERAAMVERLRLVFRTGSPQERESAIESLQALDEIEDF